VGIKTIMEARAILLLAFGENKAAATAGRSRTSPGLSSPRGGGSGERGIVRHAWAGFARSEILSWWQKRGAVLIDIPADRFAERSEVTGKLIWDEVADGLVIRGLVDIQTTQPLIKVVTRASTPANSMSVTIDWSVIDPAHIRPVEHSQLAGLQVADAVASSLFAAVNPNRYGDTEDRYARLIFPTVYRHKGDALGYGIKFWPGDFDALKAQNPHLAGFAEA